MKGVIKPDHIPVNKYELFVVGLPPIGFVKVSGIEEQVDAVELPDRTIATGGRTKPVDFKVEVPMHHTVEQAAMEIWLREAQDPVTPTYKKPATLIHRSLSGETLRTDTLLGLWVKSRKLPDLELNNDGDMAVVEYGLQADDIPI